MKIDFLTATEQASDPAHTIPLPLQLAGRIADANARRRVFLDYHDLKAKNTLDQQRQALRRFRAWLSETADPGDLFSDPVAWAGVTWGLCGGFLRHLLAQGYAISTVNAHLATLKRYATMACQAGTLGAEQYALIRTITGFSRRDGRNINQKRAAAAVPTRRRGSKAAEPIFLANDQVEALKNSYDPETPQGRRDRLMMHLFLEMGLRCGELAGLKVADLRLKVGQLRFYRPKVDNIQTHRLPKATREAARAYIQQDAPDDAGTLILASHKSGELLGHGMSERAINKRVGYLGRKLLGIEGLSPHDLRHTWATLAAAKKTPLNVLMHAGGWSSLAMPLRYIEAAKIANEGIRLG